VFSRRVVGWSIDASPTSALVTNALSMAIENRAPRPGGGLIVHSDQGPQAGSRPGRSPPEPASQGCSRRWAVSVTASTARILGRWSSPLWQDRRGRCWGWPDPCL
jgi:hypothetical protein